VIIGDYTINEVTRKPFSSLLPGINDSGKLRFAGRIGTGFTDKMQREMPEITYAEMTADGVFRHPSFKGMRTGKNVKEGITEIDIETTKPSKEVSRGKAVKVINGHELKFTHLLKAYWPEEGYTKRDMFNYYYRIAEYILPCLKDRPLSLNRFPNGIHGKSFYQKNVKGNAPEWVKTFPYISDGDEKEFLAGSDEATLLWMASLGCIEMNPLFSRNQTEDYPDFCIIDLDPDKNTFDRVIEAALIVKKVPDATGVPSYPKTSGLTGIHIYIPLGAKYTCEQSQIFARLVVTLVHQQIPAFTTLERMISNREVKMYPDYLQNRPGAAIASPYSLRPGPRATVSMPLHWIEVKKGLKMNDFTIKNTFERLKIEGDIFKGVLGKGIIMEDAIEKAGLHFSEEVKK